MQPFTFHIPTKIIFGPGRINELDQHIPRLYKNILIVTDKQVAEKSGALQKAINQLKKRNLVIFDKVEENPSFKTIKAGQDLAIHHQSQLIIGLGGGFPMDWLQLS
jgi:alcohol dehydrogenase class IV